MAALDLRFMKKIFFLILILSSSGFSQSPKKLVILGDSLTEGLGVAKDSAFPHLLELKLNTLGPAWQVINAGVSGSTTASALSRVRWHLKSNPNDILIILGANDGLRGLKTEQSEKNLSAAIEFAQKEKVKVLLGGLYMPPNYGKDYTDKFKVMYSQLAKKYKLPLVPFILDKVAGDPKLNQPDGLHPNEQGHKIIAETIYQSIKGQL